MSPEPSCRGGTRTSPTRSSSTVPDAAGPGLSRSGRRRLQPERRRVADVTDDAAGEAARATLLDQRLLTSAARRRASTRLGEIGAVPSYLAGFLCVLAAAGMLHQLTITLRRRRQRPRRRPRPRPSCPQRRGVGLTWQAVLTGHRRSQSSAPLAGAVVGPLVWRIIAEPTRRADGDPVPRRGHPDRRLRRRSRRRARVARPTAAGSAPATRRDVEGRMKRGRVDSRERDGASRGAALRGRGTQ